MTSKVVSRRRILENGELHPLGPIDNGLLSALVRLGCLWITFFICMRELICFNLMSPICIGPLVPEPVHTRSEAAHPVPEDITSVTLQSHPFGSYLKKVTSPRERTIMDEAEAPDSEILTLKSCGHSFHTKCLSSWFLLQRHDCPVCRAPYYKRRLRGPRALMVSAPAFY